MAAEAKDEANEVVAQVRAQTQHRETRGMKKEISKGEMIEYRDSNFKDSNGMFEANMLTHEVSACETKSNITPSNDGTTRNEFDPKILEDVKNAYQESRGQQSQSVIENPNEYIVEFQKEQPNDLNPLRNEQ